MKSKLIVLLILTMIISISCDSESNELNETLKSEDLKFVGIEHNKFLEDTYDFLNESKDVLRKQSQSINKSNLENFLVNKINSETKYPEEYNAISVNNTISIFNNQNGLRSSSDSEIIESLSEIEKSYLQQLFSLLENSALNDLNTIDRITELENEIGNQNLTNNQLLILYSATQTAKYSFTYWSENWEEWSSLTESLGNKRDYPGAQILEQDAIGAVAGAAGALAVNVIVGPGQVAYGGAIVGSAAAFSAAEAASQFFDWLF